MGWKMDKNTTGLTKEQYKRIKQMLEGTTEDRSFAIHLIKQLDHVADRVPFALLANMLTPSEKEQVSEQPWMFNMYNKPITEQFSECTKDFHRELIIERYVSRVFGLDTDITIIKNG